MLKTTALCVCTAVAEIIGCYLPYLWLKKQAPAWVLLPAALSLAVFVWLISLHPQAAARTYAAYGGVYIGVALLWLWQVDGVPLRWSDWLGAALSLAGMMVIMWGSKT